LGMAWSVFLDPRSRSVFLVTGPIASSSFAYLRPGQGPESPEPWVNLSGQARPDFIILDRKSPILFDPTQRLLKM